MMTTTRSRLLASSFLAGAALLAAAPAFAQSTEPTTGNVKTTTTENSGQATPSTREVPNAGGVNAPGDTGAQVGEVVVTGSRIARRDYVADSPIVSVGPKAVENTGAPTLDKLFNEIPQFVPGLGTSNNNPGNNGQVNIDLRGLGFNRNLVLLDGRRVTPSNTNGTVDINNIPQALIENVEVVTGGQSTSYGSDAIAGVVNFKLKHNFQGVVVDANYGSSDQGDAQSETVNVTAGSNFADGKGNAVVSLGYANLDSLFFGQRPNVTRSDFATISPGFTTDPRILAVSGLSGTKPQGAVSFLSTNLPTQTAVSNLFAGYGYTGSAVVRNTYSLGVNNDGTLFNGPANYKGPTSIDFSTIPVAVQSNGGSYNTGALNYIQTPLTRYNAFARAEYAVTPDIKAYAQFFFTDYTSDTLLAPSPASGNPTGSAAVAGSGGTGFLVAATNPFISNDLRTLLNSRADPNAPFVFAKRFSDVGGRLEQDEYTTYQSTVGITGSVPGRDLTFDIYASYGHYNDTTTESGNISHANFAAVLANPITAGGGACSGYDPFGTGNTISSACKQYISPQTKNQSQYTQRVVEGDLQGKLFDTPDFYNGHFGGEVRFAAGVDYRSDSASFLPDALLSSSDNTTNSYTAGGTTYNLVNNTAGVVGFNAGEPVAGTIDVYESYAELLVPIVKDLPFLKSVNLDLGGRYSDYSTVGSVYTYKADLEWKVTDWLLLRGGYSRAIRAPNVAELFQPPVNGFPSIGAPSPTGLGTGDPCDVGGGARKGVGGVNAASIRNLCLALGVPSAVIDTFQGDNTQVQQVTGGNPNLQPERANTYTAGFVLQPKFNMPLFRHISASVDYYNIEINGAISAGGIDIGTQLQTCFNENGLNPTYSANNSLCKLIVRDPTSGQIISDSGTAINLGGIRTSGIDFQVDWNFALSSLPYLGLSDRYGSLAFNLAGTWLNDFDEQTQPGGVFYNFRDSIGAGFSAFPVWKALLNVDYAIGPFDFGVIEHYIGNMRDSSCVEIAAPCTARGADPEFYTDITARWKINDMLELRGGVDNVTNQDPRFYASANASQGQTDSSTYDLIGRRYFVALKARF